MNSVRKLDFLGFRSVIHDRKFVPSAQLDSRNSLLQSEFVPQTQDMTELMGENFLHEGCPIQPEGSLVDVHVIQGIGIQKERAGQAGPLCTFMAEDKVRILG